MATPQQCQHLKPATGCSQSLIKTSSQYSTMESPIYEDKSSKVLIQDTCTGNYWSCSVKSPQWALSKVCIVALIYTCTNTTYHRAVWPVRSLRTVPICGRRRIRLEGRYQSRRDTIRTRQTSLQTQLRHRLGSSPYCSNCWAAGCHTRRRVRSKLPLTQAHPERLLCGLSPTWNKLQGLLGRYRDWKISPRMGRSDPGMLRQKPEHQMVGRLQRRKASPHRRVHGSNWNNISTKVAGQILLSCRGKGWRLTSDGDPILDMQQHQPHRMVPRSHTTAASCSPPTFNCNPL